jgi:hypothetical protein
MTGDTSRNCLDLVTSVGSTIRQIVDARVLQTAAAPPALPGGGVAARSLAHPSDAITPFTQSTRCRWRQAARDRPDEACQFAGDCGSDDIGRLASANELAIAGAEPNIRLPGDLANFLAIRAGNGATELS